MYKVIPHNAFVYDVPRIHRIKRSSRGILGADFSSLIKVAGEQFAHRAQELTWFPGEIPLHLLGLGDSVKYGSNINGDGFCPDTCRSRHHTFVKNARYYRNHDNTDSARSYGRVVDSFYNEPMGRIELLVGLYGTKEAAERFGGLVADWEQELLEKDEEIPVSMSCTLPKDFCSSCKNAARSRKEYCLGVDEGGRCPHGGLRHCIGTIRKDGHQLHAQNPGCTFVDISGIFSGKGKQGRQADRIAYATGAVLLQKAAAENRVVCGAELAEILGLEDNCGLDEQSSRFRKLAQELAQHEAWQSHRSLAASHLNYAAGGGLCERTLGLPSTPDKRAAQELTQALCEKQITLPPRDYLQLSRNLDVDQAHKLAREMASHLPGAYTRLEGKVLDIDKLPLAPGRVSATRVAKLAALAKQVEASLQPDLLESRARRAILTQEEPQPQTSTKSASGEAAALAEEYALYRLACLDAWRDCPQTQKLAGEIVVRQHHLA